MTALHLAARERWYSMAAMLVKRCPAMANAVSGQRQPPNWTPLMSLANAPAPTNHSETVRGRACVELLVANMETRALNVQSGTGGTCSHLAIGRGNLELVRHVLWSLHERGQDALDTHLAAANNAGKSLLDVAWRNNSDFAMYLQNYWRAPGYTQPPAHDERGYSQRWQRY